MIYFIVGTELGARSHNQGMGEFPYYYKEDRTIIRHPSNRKLYAPGCNTYFKTGYITGFEILRVLHQHDFKIRMKVIDAISGEDVTAVVLRGLIWNYMVMLLEEPECLAILKKFANKHDLSKVKEARAKRSKSSRRPRHF